MSKQRYIVAQSLCIDSSLNSQLEDMPKTSNCIKVVAVKEFEQLSDGKRIIYLVDMEILIGKSSIVEISEPNGLETENIFSPKNCKIISAQPYCHDIEFIKLLYNNI